MVIHPELRACYGIVLPWIPAKFQTAYHNPDTRGPWAYKAICTGGNHDTMESAIAWGQAHLQGLPYQVRLYAGVGTIVRLDNVPGKIVTPWPRIPEPDSEAGLYVVIKEYPDDLRAVYRIDDETTTITCQAVETLIETERWDTIVHLSRLSPG